MAIAFRIALRKAALLLCQQGLGKLEELEQWLLEQAYESLQKTEDAKGIAVINQAFSLTTTENFMAMVKAIPEDVLDTVIEVGKDKAEPEEEEVVETQKTTEESTSVEEDTD